MNRGEVNEHIIETIKKNSGEDRVVSKFLIDLICEESDHHGQWWWSEVYKQKIEEYSSRWSPQNED